MNYFLRTSIRNILVLSIVVSGMGMLHAQEEVASSHNESKLAGIVFPVAELGNCNDKASCREYCEEADHIQACATFAQVHGLMSKDEAKRAETFSLQIKKGSGPGGCTSPSSCRAYCEDIANMERCVSFAEKNNFKGNDYEHGKKINQYLKSGGVMPGGCTSRTSCEAYCSDFSHAEECFRFSEKAGIGQKRGDKEKGGEHDKEPTLEQMKKLSELVKSGETPGKCTSKDTCEKYCRAERHFEECSVFAEKMGFINDERRDMMKKTGGKGPGGCDSQEACHAYCNDPSNRETCFTFAEENNLIHPEELQRMKEGMVRIRQGLGNAPQEVKECLTSTLGQSALDDIQSAKIVPGPEFGNTMRRCFEKFGGKHDPTEVFNNAPDEAKVCFKEKLGDGYENVRLGKTEMTPEMGDAVRVCFELSRFNEQEFDGPRAEGDEEHRDGQMNQRNMQDHADHMKTLFKNAPEEVTVCLKGTLGAKYEQISNDGLGKPDTEIGGVVRGCFEQFRPQSPIQRQGESEQREMQGGTTRGMPTGMSPEIIACLKGKMGEDFMNTIKGAHSSKENEVLMRECFDKQAVGPEQSEGKDRDVSIMRTSRTQSGVAGGWIARLPIEVKGCLKEKFGAGYISLGQKSHTPETERVLKACQIKAEEKRQKDQQMRRDKTREIFPSFSKNKEEQDEVHSSSTNDYANPEQPLVDSQPFYNEGENEAVDEQLLKELEGQG